MAFDECPPTQPTEKRSKPQLLGLTAGWSVAAHQRTDQALFGIVQGGVYLDLRSDAAQSLAKLICLGMQLAV